MNKLELIDALKEICDISKAQSQRVVELFFESMTNALVGGERVEIRGLCLFSVREYQSYTGRNPKTGETVRVKSKRLPYFKPGTELKLMVDNGQEG